MGVTKVSLSAEAINQSIFTATLFLTVISVPKLVSLSIWNSYRLLIFKNMDKVTNRYLPRVMKGDILEAIKKLSADPEYRLTKMAKTYGDYAEDIRDPTIEGITAIALMSWLYFVYPDISIWLIASVIATAIVLVIALIILVILLKEANRIKLQSKETTEPQN